MTNMAKKNTYFKPQRVKTKWPLTKTQNRTVSTVKISYNNNQNYYPSPKKKKKNTTPNYYSNATQRR